MKKLIYSLILIVSILSFTACSAPDEPKADKGTVETNKDDTTTTTQNDNKEKTDDITKADDNSKEATNGDAKSLIADSVWQTNIEEDEKIWIAKIVKLFSDNDKDGIKKVVGGAAKTHITELPTALDDAMKPLEQSGKIVSVLKTSKELATDNDGKEVTVYTALCEGELSNMYFKLIRNDDFELTGFQLADADAIDNQAELQSKYSNLIDKSNEIINIVKEKNYDGFVEATSTVEATEAEIKDVYQSIERGFDTASGMEYRNVIVAETNTDELDDALKEYGKIIEVMIMYKSDNYSSIMYYFFYDEKGNLITINYNRVA